jgi:hypothetical protein
LLQGVPKLPERAVAAPLQAEHAADLPQRDLNADSGQEPDQHGSREKIGQESQAHDARQNQESRGHQRQHAGQRQVLIGADGCDPHETGGEDGRRRRIGAHHQVP